MIGLTFEVHESGIDEDPYRGETPEAFVSALSDRKAEAVARFYEDAIVIGADTIVVVDGRVLGKPSDRADAAHMLTMLSGRTHFVYTGFTLMDRPSDRRTGGVERTAVTFRRLADDEISEYTASGSPMDKAGAYGIQDDMGAVFVERIEGCFYNVMGLPLSRLYITLRDFAVSLTTS